MKAFLVLLVLSAAGLAGVLYFRRSVQAPRPPVVASAEPVKDGKERRHRRRRGAKRLARNAVSAGTAPSSPGAVSPGDVPPGEAYPSESPPGGGRPAGFAAVPDERPAIPGGSSVSEAPPEDVFGPAGPSPSAPSAAGSGRRQPVDEPPPIKLTSADLKIVWQGEDLSRAETMRLDFSNEAGGHELTDAEIDARFRTKEDAVLGCIARSRPNEDAYVPGRVTVKFRIQRTGTVKGVQVEAPVILHRGGLMGCIKNVLGTLRFPASTTGQVVSFPFSLM